VANASPSRFVGALEVADLKIGSSDIKVSRVPTPPPTSIAWGATLLLSGALFSLSILAIFCSSSLILSCVLPAAGAGESSLGSPGRLAGWSSRSARHQLHGPVLGGAEIFISGNSSTGSSGSGTGGDEEIVADLLGLSAPCLRLQALKAGH